jgi:glycosyltransferase involved in cell wall biosynthesis
LNAVRILYFADIRFPIERANGIQTMETCYGLAARGHTVHLVVRPDTQTPPRDPFEYYGRPSHPDLLIERAPTTGPGIPSGARRVSYLAFAAGRAAGRRRADIVMTRDLAVGSLLLRVPRPPLVYESHGYAPDVAAALPDLVSTARAPSRAKLDRLAKREARVWAQADGYVTITGNLAAELTRRFGPRTHLAVVADGTRVNAERGDLGDGDLGDADLADSHDVDRADLRGADLGKEGGSRAKAFTVGYAGHLYTWKGVDILLHAIAQVPDVRGLIVGGHEAEPDLARLRTLAERLTIGDRIRFTGLVPPATVPAMLARADVLALPNPASALSTQATSPLKLFEYMAAGRAIIASDLPAIREVLTHDVTAWLVEPGSPDAIAAGLRRLAGDPPLRERLARAARAGVAEYSWDRRAERLESLFAEVLAAGR